MHAFGMLRGGDSGMSGDRLPARLAEVSAGGLPELAILAATCAGEPRVVLMQGDTGIGKPSLVSELLHDQPRVPPTRSGLAARNTDAQAT